MDSLTNGVTMRLVTWQARELLGINKTTYAGLLQRNFLVCTYPSRTSGVSNKYGKTDMYRNMLFVDLVKGGLKQNVAFSMAKEMDVKLNTIIWEAGNFFAFRIDMKAIRQKVKEYDA